MPEHELCGSLTYTSTFDGAEISSDESVVGPVHYFAANYTHDIYSENQDLIDTTDGQNKKPYTVTAFLSSWPSTSSEATAIIEFLDPCPDPESVIAPDQNNPADYYYTA